MLRHAQRPQRDGLKRSPHAVSNASVHVPLIVILTEAGEERYLAAAIQAGETVWSRGLLKKGPGE
jgi:hypothetical protein